MTPFDPADPAFLADPYPVYARMRSAGGVHPHPGLGFPVAVSHAACSAVLRDRALGRTRSDVGLPMFDLLHRNSLLEREGEPHTRLRRLVAAAFDRGHAARLGPAVQRRADDLVRELADRVDDGEPADVITGVAEPLPVAVIADLLGVPGSERAPLRGWSDAIVRMYEPDPGDDVRAAAERASTQFVSLLRELAGRGGAGLIGDLDAVRDADGSRLSADELVGTAVLLLMAGHEATVNVIGNGVRALLDRPAAWARIVAGPELVPSAVEELIRFDAPLQLFERTALRDTVVDGTPVPSGSRIGALLGAAGRDPAVFAAPDGLDPGRTPNPHLGFGAGVHYCLGAPLARTEVAAVLRALAGRLPDMAPAGAAARRPRFVLRGWSELRIHRA